jgi:hypothetical protein
MKYQQGNPTNEEVDVSGVHVLVTAAYNALLEFVDALIGDGEDSELVTGKFESNEKCVEYLDEYESNAVSLCLTLSHAVSFLTRSYSICTRLWWYMHNTRFLHPIWLPSQFPSYFQIPVPLNTADPDLHPI